MLLCAVFVRHDTKKNVNISDHSILAAFMHMMQVYFYLYNIKSTFVQADTDFNKIIQHILHKRLFIILTITIKARGGDMDIIDICLCLCMLVSFVYNCSRFY